MERIAIVTDSNSGVTEDEARSMGIYVLPMPFSIDGKPYKEGVDLDHKSFYRFMENDSDVSTSQPGVADLMDFWSEVLKTHDAIVHIPMSSGLSSSYQTAVTFSNEDEFAGKVYVVNNQRISVTQRYSVIEAYERVKAGYSAKEIKDFLEDTRFDASIYITVDTLKYLKKGGRVTAAGAALANVLNLKPVLKIEGEKLDAFSKARGMKMAKNTMIKAIKNDIENKFGVFDNLNDKIDLEIAHTADAETVAIWRKEVSEAFPGCDIYVSELSLSIACHIGQGALALAVSQKHTI